MPGLADFAAEAILNHATGAIPLGATKTRYLALYTSAPTSDAGTGGTEVSGGAYARVQIAGALAAGASWTTASTAITLGASAPAWLTALGASGSGVNVYDATTGVEIGTVASVSGSTVNLTAAALAASSGAADSLQFSAFGLAAASSGTEPAVTPAAASLAAQIAFAQSTAAWGTVVAFGIYDAATAGNLYLFDYLNLSGAGKWSPFSCTSASPGVLTVADQTFANGNDVVVSSKGAGTLPTLASGSWAGLQTVAGVSGNTFNLGLNTTSIGDGLIRPVTPLVIGATPTTVQFAPDAILLSAA